MCESAIVNFTCKPLLRQPTCSKYNNNDDNFGTYQFTILTMFSSHLEGLASHGNAQYWESVNNGLDYWNGTTFDLCVELPTAVPLSTCSTAHVCIFQQTDIY